MASMESKATYTLLHTEDKPIAATTAAKQVDWDSYPGNRRTFIESKAAASDTDTIFIKSGGNALQAVSRKVVENQNMVAVTIREGMKPGDALLVTCPKGTGRIISAVVPAGGLPGHTFLVQMPPVTDGRKVDTAADSKADRYGQANNDNKGCIVSGTTKVVPGHDIEHTDLRLHEDANSNEAKVGKLESQAQSPGSAASNPTESEAIVQTTTAATPNPSNRCIPEAQASLV